MDFSVFFTRSEWVDAPEMEFSPSQLMRQTIFYHGDDEQLNHVKVAIIGVCDARGHLGMQGFTHAPDEFRKWFYQLHVHDEKVPLIDLGNIHPGEQLSDTYYALSKTCEALIKRGIIPLIIGGSQDLTYANYMAYESLEQTINVVTIDSRLDFGSQSEIHHRNYLNRIVLHKPNYLFNYSNIGHQRYLVDKDVLALVGNMYFDAYRLGDMQGNMQRTEPVLRNADLVSFDMSAIRMSESPGSNHAGPNGFYGEEAAQLCKYAGVSDKLTSFGIYELNPNMDLSGQSAHLAAQMAWCFIEGVSQRKSDYPVCDFREYTKFIVPMLQEGHELIFYKSPKSDRWWMEVPYPSGQEKRYERHHLVPCSHEEYQQATNEEMPDRWWKTYQKLV
ncbi:MAG: formimidoylglutamase [Flavobacteriales bacterium]